jgi:hypothetical protein
MGEGWCQHHPGPRAHPDMSAHVHARPLPSRTRRTRRPGGAGVGCWWSVVRSPRPGDLGIELLVAVRTSNVVP